MADVYKVTRSDLVSVADAIRAKGETAEQLAFPGGFVTAIQDISTGAALNFQVVGGTTEPENPTENTIWVSTDQTITGWVFSHNQPDSPFEGMVWIVNGISGVHEFDAVSDVSLRVQVASAKQYISGAWVIKTTQVYQNGAWCETILYLYNNGYNNTSVTGGWTTTKYDLSSSITNQGTPTITYNTSDIKYASNQNQHCIFNTAKKVDLTPYKTLKAIISSHTKNNNNSSMRLVIRTTPGQYYGTHVAGCDISGANTYNINIESLNGEYFIVFCSYSGNTAYIKQIYLE